LLYPGGVDTVDPLQHLAPTLPTSEVAQRAGRVDVRANTLRESILSGYRGPFWGAVLTKRIISPLGG
jgi:hypothetical protein